MSKESPLSRLRRIKNLELGARRRHAERDRLIAQALEEGASERQVADASGLSKSRVHEIRPVPDRKLRDLSRQSPRSG